MRIHIIRNAQIVTKILLDYIGILIQNMENKNGFLKDGIVLAVNMLGWIKKFIITNYVILSNF